MAYTHQLTKDDLSPFYVVRVDLRGKDGATVAFERRFYSEHGIQKLAKEIAERAERFYKERDEDEIYEDRDLAYLLLKLEELALLYDKERGSYD